LPTWIDPLGAGAMRVLTGTSFMSKG
jgi:hypothetical protein